MLKQTNSVVGNCPRCGAPIYSSGSVEGNSVPQNVYSCDCRKQPKEKTTTSNRLIKHGSFSTIG